MEQQESEGGDERTTRSAGGLVQEQTKCQSTTTEPPVSSDIQSRSSPTAATDYAGRSSSLPGTESLHSSRSLLLPHAVDESLLEPFQYISSVPGKDVRSTLLDCFNGWLCVPDATLAQIKTIVANLHNASLLIDDIEDNSKLRRGIPVAHHIFGVPTVINTANYVYFLALEQCHRLDNPRAMQVFVGEMLNLHRGQGQDIAWRDSLYCPTEDEYIQMVCDKTGGLFRLAVGLLQAEARHCQTTVFSRLVNNLAIYFQIRDDYINLADEEYCKSKSFCEDLTEGKFSFPIIHCIRQDDQDHRLINILRQRTEDVEIKRYAQRLLKEAGSLAYSRDKCREVKRSIIADVDGVMGGNTTLLKLIDVLDIQLDKMDSIQATNEAEWKGSLHIDQG